MNDTLDSFLDELQGRVYDDTRESMGEEVYRRWKNPVYLKKMEQPSAQAELTGSCGDSITIYLKIMDGRVIAANFETTGCGSSQVSGEVVCEYAIGKSVEEAGMLDGKDVLQVLGGLPEENTHCAYLAAETLREAARNYLQRV
ncbi:MAG: iron-sulfur cluster assembly scaffold protein [Desulfoplanes sp.]